MITSPSISMGRNALAIADDATLSLFAGSVHSFSDISEVVTELVSTKPYATYEPDFWVLDGSYKFAPATNAHAGLIGNTLSTSPDGNFAVVLDLEINFTTTHSTTGGMSFTFSSYSGDWLDYVVVKYYDASFALIREDTYNPTGTGFSTGQAVSNFKRIHITLNSTNKVFRFPRISRIDFDTVTRFAGTEIKSARLTEQINPISVEVPINTLDFSLFSSDGRFNVISPAGVYADLQNNEPIDVYEMVGNANLYMGRFYLDEWESKSENEAAFKAVNAVGILEKTTFLGYLNFVQDAQDVVDLIALDSGLPIDIDASLASIVTAGWIPVGSCRNALQQLAFAVGAYVACARSRTVQILPTELASSLSTYDYSLTSTEKGINSPITLKPFMTGVEITSHRFLVEDEDWYEILYRETLAAGDYRLFFDVATWDTFIVTGATNTTSGGWRGSYIDINVASPGEVVITGSQYRDTLRVHSVYNGAVPANTQPNIIRVTNGTIVHPNRGGVVAQAVYDYYLQRYVQKTKLFASSIAPGNSALVSAQGGQIGGIVERMTTDLAGGMVQDVEIVGVVAA